MQDEPGFTPAILELIHAAKYKDGSLSFKSHFSSAGSLLFIVTQSNSRSWKQGRAYFVSNGELPVLIDIEGYIFYFGHHEEFKEDKDVSLPQTVPYIKLCEQIITQSNSSDRLMRFRGHVFFLELLFELYRVMEQTAYDTKMSVEQTKEYMDNHYYDSMSIEGLASMSGVSPAYYLELFKKLIGRSPIDYLTSVRIHAAKRLIDETGSPAHQVAQAVGYKDPFYFSRQFKRTVGLSPSRYAKRNLKKIVSYHYPMTGQILALQNIPFAAPLDREFCLFYNIG